jgi:hypothetical protein
MKFTLVALAMLTAQVFAANTPTQTGTTMSASRPVATVESARLTARSNAAYLAESWRSSQGFNEGNLLVKDDTTISRDCIQGDGWVNVEYVSASKEKTILKCSTYNRSIGCMPEAIFASKDYASEEGRCNRAISVPLNRLNQ